MNLTSGTRLGPYEIGPAIGAGGMGTVYRARDTRLNRDVAVKVLSHGLSADPQMRERFAREARSISALSHPNICPLYDVGSSDGIDYLVMELLDGESLASRLERGPLPVAQAVALGVEIALALDAAHRAGVAHRDLKPGNILLTRNGARLLDFGLAKMIETSAESDSTTMHAPLTRDGSVVGTLQYMAPEQLEGKRIDSRTDIFAFGLVLYEMLSGRRAFDGTSRASIATAVLTSQPPPLRMLNPEIPAELERIVTRCLEKSPDDRWQSARDLAEALRWTREPAREATVVSPARGRRFAAVAGALALAGLVLVAALLARGRTPRELPPPVRFSLSPPAGLGFSQSPMETQMAVSPDGRHIALIAVQAGGKRKLMVRRVDLLDSRMLEGTDGAGVPFWSPDSKWIGFFVGGVLKKVPVAGGPPQTICRARGNTATWSRSGQILFSEWGPGSSEAIRVVSDGGGDPRDLTRGDRGWFLSPSFLPDGRRFVAYLLSMKANESGVYVFSIDNPREAKLLLRGTGRAEVRGDHIYYVRGSTLVRQRFNNKELMPEGDALPLGESLFHFGILGMANFSVSADGSVVAWQRMALPTQLVWRDWSGRELGRAGKPEHYRHFSTSPDGQRIAADIFDPANGMSNVWLFDVDRPAWTRVTSNPAGASAPLWLQTRDALVVTWGAQESTGAPNLHVLTLADGSLRSLRPADGVEYATGVAAGDEAVLFTVHRGRYSEIEMVPITGGKATPLGSGGEWNERDAVLSPDQRWIAFQSDESGQPEIYVRQFRTRGEKLRVSSEGGTEPHWTKDGKTLTFISRSGMLMKVDFHAAERPRAGRETVLFRIDSAGMMEVEGLGLRHYALAGEKIVVREIPGGQDADPVVVLVNAPP